jgi:hypothetical protein
MPRLVRGQPHALAIDRKRAGRGIKSSAGHLLDPLSLPMGLVSTTCVSGWVKRFGVCECAFWIELQKSRKY